MLRIRLRRIGKKKQPSYRIVVVDSRAPRDGAYIDLVGHYNPLTDPPTITINEERALKWLRDGAQPSDPVQQIFSRSGVLEKVKVDAGTS